jgi:alkylation response protein AidB-like acyl-CoA dehydrogenase
LTAARERRYRLIESCVVSIDFLGLAAMTNQADGERVRQLVGRALVHRAVQEQLGAHVFQAVTTGALPPTAGSIIRAFMADVHNLETDTAIAIVGASGAVGVDTELMDIGTRYLARQTANIGGGTTEMALNVIGERVLNFPREYAADRGVPFNQIRRGRET